MREENNTWRNKFSPSDLKKEDWLEPSEDLFSAIEEEIYGPKKEKKIAYLLPLLGLGVLLLLLTFGLIYFSNNTADKLPNPISEISEAKTISSTEDQKIDVQGNLINTSQGTSDLDKVETEYKQEVAGTNVSGRKIISKTESLTSQLPTAKESSSSTTLKETRAVYSNSSFSPFQTGRFIEGYNSSKVIPPTRPLESFASMSRKQIGSISSLEGKKIFISWLKDEKIKYTADIILDTPVNLPKLRGNKKNIFYLGFGAQSTKYKLNEAFSTAVDPADFENNDGKGIAIDAGWEYSLRPRISFFVEGGYNRTSLASGHNSAYDYDKAEETNSSNPVVLTMATPLGFMQGSVLVSRESDTQEVVPMILDLKNEHRYHVASLSAGMNYTFLELNKLSFSATAGIGIDRIFGLSNRLTEVTSSDSDFGTSDRMITADQSSLRKTLPRSILGLGVSLQLSPDRSIRLAYKWNKGLKAIHSENTISTGMSRHRLSLEALQRF